MKATVLVVRDPDYDQPEIFVSRDKETCLTRYVQLMLEPEFWDEAVQKPESFFPKCSFFYHEEEIK